MKKAICIALALISLGRFSAADAATYSYVGLPFDDASDYYAEFGDDGNCVVYDDCMITPGRFWTGGFSVDEARLPPGILVNATLDLLIYRFRDDDGNRIWESVTGVSSSAGTYREVLYGNGWTSTVVSLFGHMDDIMESPNDQAEFTFVLGDRGQIVSWSLDQMDGGDNDAGSFGRPGGFGGDGYANGQRTAGPGTWSGGPEPVVPAPVPLPAALPLLALALGTLGLAGRRRRA